MEINELLQEAERLKGQLDQTDTRRRIEALEAQAEELQAKEAARKVQIEETKAHEDKAEAEALPFEKELLAECFVILGLVDQIRATGGHRRSLFYRADYAADKVRDILSDFKHSAPVGPARIAQVAILEEAKKAAEKRGYPYRDPIKKKLPLPEPKVIVKTEKVKPNLRDFPFFGGV